MKFDIMRHRKRVNDTLPDGDGDAAVRKQHPRPPERIGMSVIFAQNSAIPLQFRLRDGII